jgi:hypothetical protein
VPMGAEDVSRPPAKILVQLESHGPVPVGRSTYLSLDISAP